MTNIPKRTPRKSGTPRKTSSGGKTGKSATPRAPRPSRQSARQFGNTRPSALEVSIIHPPNSSQPFRHLPPPTGPSPYHISLDSVLPAAAMKTITTANKLVLHIAGDTGGVKNPTPQQIVAWQMEQQLTPANAGDAPAFFYHLGDVVYYYGDAAEYYPQFYDAYIHYTAPIFAIPGNHDGDLPPNVSIQSLSAFIENFCAPTPVLTQEAQDAQRHAMTQPNPYFTLDTPFATFVGLYTNVPEGGHVDDQQIAWFTNELKTAPKDKALIVAMHHPIYSADGHHAGSAYMGNILDTAAQQTNRWPDLVFAGHVHNYQRFTRTTNNRQIPYIVAGSGGYWNLHYMAKLPDGSPIPDKYDVPGSDVRIETSCDNRHGFMKLTIEPGKVTGEFYTVPRPQEPWRNPAERIDAFALDLSKHQIVP